MEVEIGKGRFFTGDCFDVMRDLPDGSVDLVLADPPYTMTKRGRSCRPNWMPDRMGQNVFAGEIPDPDQWMGECFRVLKDRTHFYTFCNTNDLSDYLIAAKKVGFRFHNLISMVKDTGMPNRWYLKQTELILFFRKGAAKPINDMTSRDWVRVEMPTKASGKIHITQKPLNLIKTLVANNTQLGEFVLDPFGGSGTTAVAAEAAGRRWICIERDQEYAEKAIARIRDHVSGESQPAKKPARRPRVQVPTPTHCIGQVALF
jgi:DNA modification methylase